MVDKQKKNWDIPFVLSLVSLSLPILVIIFDAISRLDNSYCYNAGFNEGYCSMTGFGYFLFKVLCIGMLIATLTIAIIALARVKNTRRRVFLVCNAIVSIILIPVAFALLIR